MGAEATIDRGDIVAGDRGSTCNAKDIAFRKLFLGHCVAGASQLARTLTLAQFKSYIIRDTSTFLYAPSRMRSIFELQKIYSVSSKFGSPESLGTQSANQARYISTS